MQKGVVLVDNRAALLVGEEEVSTSRHEGIGGEFEEGAADRRLWVVSEDLKVVVAMLLLLLLILVGSEGVVDNLVVLGLGQDLGGLDWTHM